MLTEVYGYKKSRRVIWAGFAAAALMSVTLWIVGLMPGEATWEEYAGQAAYDAILGGVATGGIIIASLVAYVAGEFSNSIVLAKMKVATEGRWLWTRTIGSTLVGQGIDTVAFVLIATLFGVFPPEIALSLIVANYIFKVTIEVNDPSKHLKPGMFGRIQIIYDVHENTLLIPKEVVLAEDAESAVFVVRDSTAYRQLVKTGFTNATHIEIVEGVCLSDTVVTTGQGSLKDSVKVEVIAMR